MLAKTAFINYDSEYDMPYLSIDPGGRDYEGGTATFQVHLSTPSSSSVSVNWFTGVDTANLQDFYSNSGVITFDPGETTKTFTVRSQTDGLPESDEFYFVELANPVGASFENGVTARASAIILDNDGAGSHLAVQVSDAFLTEGNTHLRDAVFDVTLSQVATTAQTFTYKTFDITASAGSDYTPVNGSLTFQPGQDHLQVRVPILDDSRFETAETFGLSLQPAGGGSVDVTGATGTGYIIDDDSGGLPAISSASLGYNVEGYGNDFVVRLSKPSLSQVSVDYRTVSGTATTNDYYSKSGTLMFAPGQTELVVHVGTATDTISEIDETVFLDLSKPQGGILGGDGGTLRATTFILDDDGGGSKLAVDVSAAPVLEGDFGTRDAVFVLHLSRPQTSQVTLNYQTADNTALAGQDYIPSSGSVTFLPGQDVAIVKVPVIGDLRNEGDEYFTLTVSGMVNGVTVAASGSETILASDTSGRGNLLVDDLFYNETYLDVRLSRADPDEHYFTRGASEGRNPNAFFSTLGYLAANQDVAKAGINPLSHYDSNGWKEGRDPSANFDNELYLLNNPDVKAAGIDPLAHYLQSGQAEGRQAYAAIGNAASFTHGSFDAEYYLLANPDVAKAALASGGDTFSFAFQHYEANGWHEGRLADAYFDPAYYLAHNPDVAAAGIDPLTHYDTNGWKEGRDPSAAFHTNAYLAANPDVAAAHIDPLTHYLQHGADEGRHLA